jgi:hypothetical protein
VFGENTGQLAPTAPPELDVAECDFKLVNYRFAVKSISFELPIRYNHSAFRNRVNERVPYDFSQDSVAESGSNFVLLFGFSECAVCY